MSTELPIITVDDGDILMVEFIFDHTPAATDLVRHLQWNHRRFDLKRQVWEVYELKANELVWLFKHCGYTVIDRRQRPSCAA